MTKELKSEDRKKLDLNVRILTIEKKEVPFGEEPLTVKKAISIAVLNVDAKTNTKSPEDKYKAYKLAMKIDSDNPQFTVEELAQIKKDVGNFWSPEVVGFIWDLIEDTK